MKKYSFVFILVIALYFNMTQLSVVRAENMFEEKMSELSKLGILENGHLPYDEQITRAEMASLITRSLLLPEGDKTFSDVPRSHLFYVDVNKAASSGLINGIGSDKFAPDRKLTREEMAALIDRALRFKGGSPTLGKLSFTDNEQIYFSTSVQHLVHVNIINGFPDNTFRPKENVTRGQASVTISRMLTTLKEIEQDKQQREQEETDKDSEEVIDKEESEVDKSSYYLAEIEKDGDLDKLTAFDTYQQAKDALNDYNNAVILHNDKIVWMEDGIAITDRYTKIYEEDLYQFNNFIAAGTEVQYIGADEEKVKVQFLKNVGYIKLESLTLIPDKLVEERTHYKVQDEQFIHVLYRNGSYESYVYGMAPPFIDDGEKVHSEDGVHFDEGEYYQYFNYLPLRTKTSYDAEDLDRYIEAMQPDSPLIGLGKAFKQAEEEYRVNALYLLAHAIHESAWGFSEIAKEKNNLYGINAIDSNPLQNAAQFDNFQDGILYAGMYISDRYLTPGAIYRGGLLGNKSIGMNVMYASDPYWGQKISGHMYRADQYLGEKDFEQYELAEVIVDKLNVREMPDKKADVIYQIATKGATVVVLDEEESEDGVWYKIISDSDKAEEAYIYADGELGTFVEKIEY
ncbi:S-layer homology domain-containing protein [Bacillus solimangrovi]|uniref:SLH domain-containing protein n=1 Tax=Bacillus solimangrovi TaxID=1305675 RepID=A0A1E5LDR4_9BACI|nr:S-layer homology domain-containing protein [Bacillus solimangrovi]OEH92169.1 hypothetical protein BFG57_02550 [Bacillus solimangrovi]